MSKRTAYFASGEIIECECGKAAFRRHVAIHQKYSLEADRRVWFRQCNEWRAAVKKSCDAWARQRGFVSWDAYQFVMNILKGGNDE